MDRGIQDYQLGKQKSENPYAHGSLEARLWLQGWIELDLLHDAIIQEVEAGGSC